MAAAPEGREFVIASRSDSTLRGHFPLETDVISRGLLDLAGIRTDGGPRRPVSSKSCGGLAREISTGVVETVRRCVAEIQPAWIVAKGGITSSDVATSALGIRRAWVRGTLLPGIVALWQPAVADRPGIPYVVFAGNVGSDSALRQVVGILRADSE
jgi:uncharacterized protein YgbK (DUF1537 family)